MSECGQSLVKAMEKSFQRKFEINCHGNIQPAAGFSMDDEERAFYDGYTTGYRDALLRMMQRLDKREAP